MDVGQHCQYHFQLVSASDALSVRIIVPNQSLMDQWIQEFAKFAPHLKVYGYRSINAHPSKISTSFNIVFSRWTDFELYDAVLATYDQLGRQYDNSEKNTGRGFPLFEQYWFRVGLGTCARRPSCADVI